MRINLKYPHMTPYWFQGKMRGKRPIITRLSGNIGDVRDCSEKLRMLIKIQD